MLLCGCCPAGWQVEDDRAQINAVIQQLDEKKRLALEETWKQVGQQCSKQQTFLQAVAVSKTLL